MKWDWNWEAYLSVAFVIWTFCLGMVGNYVLGGKLADRFATWVIRKVEGKK